MPKRLYYLIGIIAAAGVIQACNSGPAYKAAAEQVPNQISYNFDVRPILSDNCFACHGPDANKREAGLRLDIAEEAYKALEENPTAHALVPGKPELSVVYQRISSQDTAMIMPPAGSNLKLTNREIELIQKWIKQGAKYESHWAFVAPKKPALPQVKQKDWARNEIDYFILQKQEQKGLKP